MSEITKFGNLRNLANYRIFLRDVSVILINFADTERIWNVIDIISKDDAGNYIKLAPPGPTAGEAPSTAFIQFCDCDNILLSLFMT